MTRLRLTGFSLVLLVTMAMTTLAFFALAVASSDLQEEFGISRLQLGLLAAVNTLVGGLFAPAAGRLSDRIGGRRTVTVTLLISGVTAVLTALSQSYVMLLVSMALAGLPQALGNPGTNKAIATGIPMMHRGFITGVKQSGVQAAVFVSGAAVPFLSRNFGWRSAIWLTAGLSFAALAATPLITTRDDLEEVSTSTSGRRVKLPTFVNQVAIYALLLGAVGGGLSRFLPLFAEEEIGLSMTRAGLVFGVQGLVAIPVRLASGTLLDRGVSARLTLAVMGFGGAVAVLLILASTWSGEGLLWAGTVAAGVTVGSWNTAANLAKIRQRENAGRASGRMILGFMMGLTIGGPTVGWSVDQFGYSPAWLASAALAFAGGLAIAMRPRDEASVMLPAEGVRS